MSCELGPKETIPPTGDTQNRRILGGPTNGRANACRLSSRRGCAGSPAAPRGGGSFWCRVFTELVRLVSSNFPFDLLSSSATLRQGEEGPLNLTFVSCELGAWSYETSRAEEDSYQAAFLSSARLPFPRRLCYGKLMPAAHAVVLGREVPPAIYHNNSAQCTGPSSR